MAVGIWNPKVPSDQPRWNSPKAFPRQSFNMCLDMDFGGADGQLLESLTMVNVFMGEFPAVFHGISFTYSGGTERFYGNKSYRLRTARRYNCIVQSFPIAGPKGEFINKVETSYCKSTDSIQSILVGCPKSILFVPQLSTNSRVWGFPANNIPSSQLSTNARRSVVFHLHGEMSHLETQLSTTVIQPPPGNLLISFCAKLKVHTPLLEQLSYVR